MKFPKKALKTILIWIFFTILLFILTPKLISFFKPMLISIIIALIVYPIVRFLEKKLKFKKQTSVFFITILVFSIIFLVFYLIFNAIFEEVYNIIENLPNIYATLENWYNLFIELIIKINNSFPFLDKYIEELKNFEFSSYLPNSSIIIDYISSSFFATLNSAKSLPNIIITFIFIILFSILFILNGEEILKNIDNLINDKMKGNLVGVVKKLKDILGAYILAQIKLFFITFSIIFIGFLIVKMDYKLLLSIIIGLLDMLPFLGTGTILGPMVVFYLFNGNYYFAIACTIIYIITFIVRRTLEPKFVGNGMGISSLRACFYMFVGYQIFGVIGLIIGVPLGVVITHLYKEHFFDSLISSVKEIAIYLFHFIKLEA